MPFTLAGFGEDIDAAGVEANMTALVDAHLFVNGDDLRVPSLNSLLFAWGGIGSGGTTLMRLSSPSLRDQNRLVITPLNHIADSDAEPSDPLAIFDISQSPRVLTPDEILQVIISSNTSAAAFQWLLLGFGSGPPVPVGGEIVTVRATGATTQTARVWSTVTLSFADTLPAGTYQVVGLRAFAASLVAARFVFKPGTWRPGCPGVDSHATMDYPLFRAGRMGVWGEFNQTTPPDIECLSDLADTAQTFDIDLIKVG